MRWLEAVWILAILSVWMSAVQSVSTKPFRTSDALEGSKHACYKKGERVPHPASLRSPLDAEPLALDARARMAREKLPRNFDWRSATSGKACKTCTHHVHNYVVQDVNQHIPEYCGSCWAHGSAAMIGDRIKVARRARWPDISVARQVIIDCVDQGCGGGDPWDLFTWMASDQGVLPDETCAPYLADGKGRTCLPKDVCSNCLPKSMAKKLNGTFDSVMDDKGCFEIPRFAGMSVHHFGNITGESAMMREIYARGPIVCSMAATDEFLLNYSQNAAANGGVYTHTQEVGEDEVDHNVEVVGWGETESAGEIIPYWIVRNSWGTYWGAAGWFYIRRGKWNLRIEEDCQWADIDTSQFDLVYDGHVSGSYTGGLINVAMPLPIRPKGEPKDTTSTASWNVDDVPGLYDEMESSHEHAVSIL